MRAICRTVGVARQTISELSGNVAKADSAYQANVFVNLPCEILKLGNYCSVDFAGRALRRDVDLSPAHFGRANSKRDRHPSLAPFSRTWGVSVGGHSLRDDPKGVGRVFIY